MTSIAVTCALLAGTALTGTLVEGGRRKRKPLPAPSKSVPTIRATSESVPQETHVAEKDVAPRTLVLAPSMDESVSDAGWSAALYAAAEARAPANLVSGMEGEKVDKDDKDMAQLPPHLRRYVDPNAPSPPPAAERPTPIGPVKPWYDTRRTDATCQAVGANQDAGSVSWADPRHAPQDRYEYVDQPRVKLTRTFGNDGRRLPVEGNTFHHPTGKQKRAYPINGREADNFLRRMTGHDPHRKARSVQLAPTFMPEPPAGVVPGGGAFMSDRERDIQAAINPDTIGDYMLPFVRPDIHQWQEKSVSYKKPTPQVRAPILAPSRAGLLYTAEPIGERRVYDDALPYAHTDNTMRPGDHHEIGRGELQMDARKLGGGTVKDVVRKAVGKQEPVRAPTIDEDLPIPRGMEAETYTSVKTVHKKLQQPHTLAYGATYGAQDTEDDPGFDIANHSASLDEDRRAHRQRNGPITTGIVHGALIDEQDTGATVGEVRSRNDPTPGDRKLARDLEMARPISMDGVLETDSAQLAVGSDVQDPRRGVRAQRRLDDVTLDPKRHGDVDDTLMVERVDQATTAHHDQERAARRGERERRVASDQNPTGWDSAYEDTADVYRITASRAGDRVVRMEEKAERRARADADAFAAANERRRADDEAIATVADSGRDAIGTSAHRAAAADARERRLMELRDRAALLRGTHISACNDGAGNADDGLLDGRSLVAAAPSTESTGRFEKAERYIVNRPVHRLDALVQNDGTDDRHYYMPPTQARPVETRERRVEAPLGAGHGAVEFHEQDGEAIGDRGSVGVGVPSRDVREAATHRTQYRETARSVSQPRIADDWERFEATGEAEQMGTSAHRRDRAWREQMMEPRVDNPDSDVLSAAVFGGLLNEGGVREQRTDRIMRREQMNTLDNLDELHTHMVAERMDPEAVVSGTLRPMAQVHAENREASLRARLRAETPPPLSMIENNARFRALGVHHQRRSPTPPGSPRRSDSPVYAGQRVMPRA